MALGTASVEDLLGVPKETSLALARAVHAGLPVAVLDNFAKLIAPDDPGFKYRLVPKSTLVRRRKSAGRLSAIESNRLARLAKAFGMALQVYGAPEKARRFMRSPHPMLEGATPIEVALAATPGADLVVNLLGRAAYSGGV